MATKNKKLRPLHIVVKQFNDGSLDNEEPEQFKSEDAAVAGAKARLSDDLNDFNPEECETYVVYQAVKVIKADKTPRPKPILVEEVK